MTAELRQRIKLRGRTTAEVSTFRSTKRHAVPYSIRLWPIARFIIHERARARVLSTVAYLEKSIKTEKTKMSCVTSTHAILIRVFLICVVEMKYTVFIIVPSYGIRFKRDMLLISEIRVISSICCYIRFMYVQFFEIILVVN